VSVLGARVTNTEDGLCGEHRSAGFSLGRLWNFPASRLSLYKETLPFAGHVITVVIVTF